MAELAVGNVYGSALYRAACDVGKKEEILNEAKELLEIFNQEKDLFAFFESPIISGIEKKKVVDEVFSGKISEELLNFLFIMIDKGRTRHFARAVKVYEELFDSDTGYSYGKIYSVSPLSDEKLKKFEDETSKLLRKNVKLENEKDASLIGGVKILIDGKIIDASVRKRLEEMNNSII